METEKERLKWLHNLLDFVKNDPEIHDAIVDFIKAKSEAERALAAWRNRRNPK